MPVPIICLEAALRQYAESFRKVFTSPQFQHLVTVLLGLVLAPERRTLTGLLSRVAGGILSAPSAASLSRPPALGKGGPTLAEALSAADGSPGPGRAGWPAAPQKGPPQFAIFDDTTMAKHLQGETEKRMAGIGQHHSSTAGQGVQGHSLMDGRPAATVGAPLPPGPNALPPAGGGPGRGGALAEQGGPGSRCHQRPDPGAREQHPHPGGFLVHLPPPLASSPCPWLRHHRRGSVRWTPLSRPPIGQNKQSGACSHLPL
jgi:hypothetical protein